MTERQRIAEYVIILGIILFLMSCGKESPKADDQPAAVEEYAVMPMEVQLTDSTKSDTLSPNKEVGNASTSQTVSESYDDGYLDGEAMAEEDRLAGKPGMQVGMDDDDDDVEDGCECAAPSSANVAHLGLVRTYGGCVGAGDACGGVQEAAADAYKDHEQVEVSHVIHVIRIDEAFARYPVRHHRHYLVPP